MRVQGGSELDTPFWGPCIELLGISQLRRYMKYGILKAQVSHPAVVEHEVVERTCNPGSGRSWSSLRGQIG